MGNPVKTKEIAIFIGKTVLDYVWWTVRVWFDMKGKMGAYVPWYRRMSVSDERIKRQMRG